MSQSVHLCGRVPASTCGEHVSVKPPLRHDHHPLEAPALKFIYCHEYKQKQPTLKQILLEKDVNQIEIRKKKIERKTKWSQKKILWFSALT